ncbi:MAG: glucose-6-phosphate dehydrogenase [Candidatus Levyibacteriota bacterium]
MITDSFQAPFSFIIFGGSGDNSYQKIYPALYDIAEKKLLPKDFAIVATGRKYTKEEFYDFFRHSVTSDNRHHQHSIDNDFFKMLEKHIYFFPGDNTTPEFYKELNTYLDQMIKDGLPCGNRLFYLGLPQVIYPTVFKNLKESGLYRSPCGWTRILIEKPIGDSEETAKHYNKIFRSVFAEDQIFRLDHYLGKETLENILSFRFENNIFEHLINRKHLDHIQITAAENFGIAKRGKFYDVTGALKDVGQNHILQMVALATMEKPENSSDEALVRARLNLIKKLRAYPNDVVYGQYDKGMVNGKPAVAYKDEDFIQKGSNTDSFFAMKLHIESKRFDGVPVYIRSGKQMEQWVTEINYVFKTQHLGDNVLTIRVQPNEGIAVKILTKKPGYTKTHEPTYMQFCYKHHFPGQSFDAYEKLIQDAFAGRHTSFNTTEEVEAEWRFIDPLSNHRTPTRLYKAGSWGPKEAEILIEKDGRRWLAPYAAFCTI